MQPFIDVGPTVDMDLLKVNSGDGGADNDEVGKVFPTIIQVPLQGFFFFFFNAYFHLLERQGESESKSQSLPHSGSPLQCLQ